MKVNFFLTCRSIIITLTVIVLYYLFALVFLDCLFLITVLLLFCFVMRLSDKQGFLLEHNIFAWGNILP